MKALLKQQVLDGESLRTLMCEVKSIVNGRPITKVSDDAKDINALTPSHLLLLRSGTTIPPGVFSKNTPGDTSATCSGTAGPENSELKI